MTSPPAPMPTRRHVLALGAAGVLACAACGSRTAPVPSTPSLPPLELARADVPRRPRDPAAARTGAGALQNLTGGLLGRLRAAPGNLVFSPASIALALGMAAEGARGATALQMEKVLGLPTGASGPALGALQLELASRSGDVDRAGDSPVRLDLDLANAVWAQRGLRWERPFLEALSGSFGAGVALADVGGDPEGTTARVNAWVAGQTHEKIPHLLAPGTLDEYSRMVLVNAAYLKAPWQTPFHGEETRATAFERLDGSSVGVPTMVRTLAADRASGPGWQAVRLPYAGGRLALAVVLPDAGRFEQVLTHVDGPWLRRLLAGFAPAAVEVHLPRWSARVRSNLVGVLTALGMPLAFDRERADFTGMTTQERLFVKDVAHEAWISVDEAGTEAAAATAVVAEAVSAPATQQRFDADRPFLVLLHDVPTGAPVFVGTVVDPALTPTS